jgi:hypothetical protein
VQDGASGDELATHLCRGGVGAAVIERDSLVSDPGWWEQGEQVQDGPSRNKLATHLQVYKTHRARRRKGTAGMWADSSIYRLCRTACRFKSLLTGSLSVTLTLIGKMPRLLHQDEPSTTSHLLSLHSYVSPPPPPPLSPPYQPVCGAAQCQRGAPPSAPP